MTDGLAPFDPRSGQAALRPFDVALGRFDLSPRPFPGADCPYNRP